jgi:hypothetical protein
MHGKKIHSIYFPSDGINDPVCKSCDEFGRLELSATYHGDHDEFWILRIKDGKEVARFNPRFVEFISWE